MPKPCGDFFAENHVTEPFLAYTEDVACSFVLSPSTRKQWSTYAFPVMLKLSELKLKTK